MHLRIMFIHFAGANCLSRLQPPLSSRGHDPIVKALLEAGADHVWGPIDGQGLYGCVGGNQLAQPPARQLPANFRPNQKELTNSLTVGMTL